MADKQVATASDRRVLTELKGWVSNAQADGLVDAVSLSLLQNYLKQAKTSTQTSADDINVSLWLAKKTAIMLGWAPDDKSLLALPNIDILLQKFRFYINDLFDATDESTNISLMDFMIPKHKVMFIRLKALADTKTKHAPIMEVILYEELLDLVAEINTTKVNGQIAQLILE